MKRRDNKKYKSINDFPEGGITAAMIAQSYLNIGDVQARAMMKSGVIPSYKAGRNYYTTRDLLKIKFHGIALDTVKNSPQSNRNNHSNRNAEILLEVAKLTKQMIELLQTMTLELQGVEKDD